MNIILIIIHSIHILKYYNSIRIYFCHSIYFIIISIVNINFTYVNYSHILLHISNIIFYYIFFTMFIYLIYMIVIHNSKIFIPNTKCNIRNYIFIILNTMIIIRSTIYIIIYNINDNNIYIYNKYYYNFYVVRYNNKISNNMKNMLMSKYNNNIKRNPFTNSNLYSAPRNIGNSMLSDLDSFVQYSINEAKIHHLIDSAEHLIAINSDKTMQNMVSAEVEEKTSKRKIVSETMRSIALRANSAFGAKSAKAKALNARNISLLRDAELETAARRIHSNASSELEALAAEGLTQAYLDKFEADINAFVAAADRVKSAQTERQLTTEKRQALAAEIYSLLSKYCSYGKMIFAQKSPAHYKRYVMHKSKKENEAEPEEEVATENLDN